MGCVQNKTFEDNYRLKVQCVVLGNAYNTESVTDFLYA